MMRLIKKIAATKLFSRIISPYHKEDFLNRFAKNKEVRILDVGCGNDSVQMIRYICDGKNSRIYYTGLDVGDYNLNAQSKEEIDEYVVVKPEEFAETILRWKSKEDVVISAHNLEHCDQPDVVLVNMIRTLKEGGNLYISFPSEDSVNFPKGYKGTLNFYDDTTHQNVPCWNNVLKILSDNDMEITYSNAKYRPLIPRIIGMITWPITKKRKTATWFTWQFFGFESIIWARKNE